MEMKREQKVERTIVLQGADLGGTTAEMASWLNPKRRCGASSLVLLSIVLFGVSMILFLASLVMLNHGEGTAALTAASLHTPPRNIIFMVSDGFGLPGVTLARDDLRRRTGNSSAQLMLDSILIGLSETSSADSMVTDSAAGATAWSCAQKTNNYYLAVDTEERPCGTLMEAAKDGGMLTGIVSTSSVTDATPAAFASHVRRRGLEHSVALQLAKTQTSSELILGGGLGWFRPQGLVGDLAAGELGDGRPWSVVNDTAAMLDATKLPLLGLFAEDDLPWEIDRVASQVPSLEQMTRKAIEMLAAAGTDERGFFLLVEGAKIDKAAHPNDAAAFVREVFQYDAAVGAAIEFASSDGQTLVISVSDHETGGLSLARGVINAEPKSEPLRYEAPLRTRSFAAEAEGVIDTSYSVSFEALDAVNASSQTMLSRAMTALATEWRNGTNASEADLLVELRRADSGAQLRGRLVAKLNEAVASATPFELMAHEESLIVEAVGFLPKLGPYVVQRAIATIVSARARIGWSTWGHSGADVLLHGFGPGTDQLRGNLANSEIGARVARMMGWDLQRTTAMIGTPEMAPQDVEQNGAFASWPGPR